MHYLQKKRLSACSVLLSSCVVLSHLQVALQPPRAEDALAAEGAEHQRLRLRVLAEELPTNLVIPRIFGRAAEGGEEGGSTHGC